MNKISGDNWATTFKWMLLSIGGALAPMKYWNIIIPVYAFILFVVLIIFLHKLISDVKLFRIVALSLLVACGCIIFLTWKNNGAYEESFHRKGIGEFVEKKDSHFIYRLKNEQGQFEYWPVYVSQDYYERNSKPLSDYCRYALLRSKPNEVVSFNPTQNDFLSYSIIKSVKNHICDEVCSIPSDEDSKGYVICKFLDISHWGDKTGTRYWPVYYYETGNSFGFVDGFSIFKNSEESVVYKNKYDSNGKSLLIDLGTGKVIASDLGPDDLRNTKYKYPVLYTDGGIELGNNSFCYAFLEPDNYLNNIGLSICKISEESCNDYCYEIEICNNKTGNSNCVSFTRVKTKHTKPQTRNRLKPKYLPPPTVCFKKYQNFNLLQLA